MCNEAPRSTMYIVSSVGKAMLFTVAFDGTYLLQKSVLWACVWCPFILSSSVWSLYAVCLAHSSRSSLRSVDLSSHGGAFGTSAFASCLDDVQRWTSFSEFHSFQTLP